MANNQTAEQTAGDDKKGLKDFFHALVNKDKPLTELPWDNLGRTETAEFLIERIERGDKEKVVENIGHFSHQLQDQKYLVLAAAVSKGYFAGDIPFAEYVTGADSKNRTALLDAIVKKGEGEQFLWALSNFAVSNNVPISNLKTTYDYVINRTNNRHFLHRLFDSTYISTTYDKFAAMTERSIEKRKYTQNLTEQLKTNGAETIALLLKNHDLYEAKKIKSDTQFLNRRSPEFLQALKTAFETEIEKGDVGTLRGNAYAAEMLYYSADESLRETVRNAVKKHPELLKAMDEFIPQHYSLEFWGDVKDVNHGEYLKLASAAVTNGDFNWKDLNLKRFTHKINLGYGKRSVSNILNEMFLGNARVLLKRNYHVEKRLDFKEQMAFIVALAKEAAETDSRVKVPEEFERFVSGGAREKLAKKLNKFRRPDDPHKVITEQASKIMPFAKR